MQTEHEPSSAPGQQNRRVSDHPYPAASTAWSDCARHTFPCADQAPLRNSLLLVPVGRLQTRAANCPVDSLPGLARWELQHVQTRPGKQSNERWETPEQLDHLHLASCCRPHDQSEDEY